MSHNNQDSQEQLPHYEPPRRAQPPPSYEKDCEDRLAQIDRVIDEAGERKQAQIDNAYDASRLDVLNTARHTLKHWNRVQANIKKRPNETPNDHVRRLKKEEMTMEDYRRSMAT